MIKTNLLRSLLAAGLVISFPAFAADKTPASQPSQTKLSPAQEKFAKDYQQAKQEFDSRQFAKSYTSFGKLLEQAPANGLVNFYYAASAAEIGEYNEAIAGYERVLMLDPKSARVRLELARIYYAMGNTEMANNELEIALRTNLPSEVRTSALAFQQKVNHKPSKHSNSTALIVGLEYDSNVFNDIGSGSSFSLDGFGGLDLQGKAEASDLGLSAALLHNYGYRFNKEWSLENQFLGYFKKNRDYSENDVQYFAVKTAPTYQKNANKFQFPLEVDYVRLDSRGFMKNFGLGAEVSHLFSDTKMLKTGAKARAMRYSGENKGRDANALLLHVDYSQVLSKDPIVLNLRANYENRNQTGSTVIDRTSLQEYLLKADLSKTFTHRVRANVAASYRFTDYKETDPWFANSREDKIWRVELGTAYKLNKKSTITGLISHAKHNSNQGAYEFDKTLIATNFIYQF